MLFLCSATIDVESYWIFLEVAVACELFGWATLIHDWEKNESVHKMDGWNRFARKARIAMKRRRDHADHNSCRFDLYCGGRGWLVDERCADGFFIRQSSLSTGSSRPPWESSSLLASAMGRIGGRSNRGRKRRRTLCSYSGPLVEIKEQQ
jgi:hypothetical protein